MFGPVLVLLALIGIVVGVLRVLRASGGPRLPHGAGPSDGRALAILRERLAKGGIDAGDFDARKRLPAK